MPVYNGAPFVGEAIESVLLQTHANLELVIVDDGSTDRTPRILDSFRSRDLRVRVLTRAHHGIVAALNIGLNACRSHLVARMDADDVALPTRLARQVQYLKEHVDCVAVGTQVRKIDVGGGALPTASVPTSHEEIVDETIHRRCAMWHPSVVYRRDAVLQIGGYRTECQWAEDLDLWLRLSDIGRLANLDEPLLKYRIHDNKVCHLRRREQRSLARRIVREFCEERGLPIPARCRPNWSCQWRGSA